MKKNSFLILSLMLCLCGHGVSAEEVASVTSPDGKNKIIVDCSSTGYVTYTLQRNGQELIAASPVGLVTSSASLYQGLAFKTATTADVDDTYTLPTGKFSVYHDTCRELVVECEKKNVAIDFVFRAYNDGIAFRYNIKGDGQTTASLERAEVRIPSLITSWAQKYALDYSQYYPARTWDETVALQDRKMCAPVLVKSSLGDDYWTLITEAVGNGDFCASSIVAGSAGEVGRFRFTLQDKPVIQLPFSSPWRTVYVGKLTDFVTSTLVENLNEPTRVEDTGWIKSGLSSWDWGGQDGSQTKDINVIKSYIDMAAAMGWPYFTLDDGWAGADYRLADVVEYAAEKGVGVFIWSHQNRFQNDEEQIRDVLSNWKRLGFVGTKIDFFENDSKAMMEKYDKILRVAAEQQMMVNFHGCIRPSGLRRTYPNLVTSEAVLGGEMYFFNSTMTKADHNVTLALTRNVIGPMDYTPVEFARKDGVIRHTTTWSHQLALATLYESGIQTISDSYDNLVYSIASPLLRVMPSSWDETRCTEAVPEEYVTILHRKGEDWYVASISQKARTVSLPLDFLGEGDYTAQIYKDGNCPSDIRYEQKKVTAATTLKLGVKATGGVSVRISKTLHVQPKYTVVESENGQCSSGVTQETDSKGNCSAGKYIGFLGKGKTVSHTVNVTEAGVYDLTLFYITLESRDCYIRVNNGKKETYSFPGNGFSWGSEGLAMKTFRVNLRSGRNTIVFGNDSGDCPNLDRFVITPSANRKNVRVTAVHGLTDRSGYTNAEPIKISVNNASAEDLTDVRVSYSVDGGAKVTETVSAISAGATADFAFDTKANLMPVGSHIVRVWVEREDERAIVGDMVSATFATLPAEEGEAVSLASNGGRIHSFSGKASDSETAGMLIDNNGDTKWCDNSNRPAWAIVQLPHEYEVNCFVLTDCRTKESQKNVDQYSIYVSTKDPSANEWTEVVNSRNRRTDNVKVDRIAPVPARYVKLVASRPEGDNAVRIYGFDVYSGISTGITSTPGTPSDEPYIIYDGESLNVGNATAGTLRIFSLGGALMASHDIEPFATVPFRAAKGCYIVRFDSAGTTTATKIIIQ